MTKLKTTSVKILFVMLLLIIVICFSACAEVRAVTIENDDGSISEMVYITLDREKLENAGYDYSEVKDDISQTGFETVTAIVNQYNDKALHDSARVNFIDKVKPLGNRWNGDTYFVGLQFESRDVYNYYYNITEETKAEPEIEEHFLYNRIIYKGTTTFADYNKLYQDLNSYYTNKYPLFASSDAEIYYTYVTDSMREHTDADFVNKIDGKYYHTWQMQANETSKQISIYYNLANRGNCILACIIASLIVCGVLLAIGFVITKINKKKQK